MAIGKDGRKLLLGEFPNAICAAMCYDDFAFDILGQTNVNFPFGGFRKEEKKGEGEEEETDTEGVDDRPFIGITKFAFKEPSEGT